MNEHTPDTRTLDQIRLEQIAIGILGQTMQPYNPADVPRLKRMASICMDASNHPESAGAVLDMVAEQFGMTREPGSYRFHLTEESL